MKIHHRVVMFFLLNLVAVKLLSATPVRAERKYISFNNTKARGLGGAYLSIVDDLPSLDWNPAALGPMGKATRRRFEVFLNPISPPVAWHDLGDFDRRWERDDNLTLSEWIYALSLIYKRSHIPHGIPKYRYPQWRRTLGSMARREASSPQGPTFQLYSQLGALSLQLAPAVSLGVSATVYYEPGGPGEKVKGDSFAFGVLLKPSPKLNVGISFVNFSDDMGSPRLDLERIGDEAINGGISYYVDSKTIFSLDLRNLNESDKSHNPSAREIHTGFERNLPLGFAIRGGYFRRRPSGHNVYSFGIGFKLKGGNNGYLLRSSASATVGYIYVTEKRDPERHHIHVISVIIPISAF